MRKKGFILATLILAFCAAAGAQSLTERQYTSDAVIDGFSGSIKRALQVTYEAVVVDNDHMRKGDVLERIETIYNSRGQRRSMAYLATEEDIIFRTRYKHDGFGLCTLEHIVDNEERVIGRTYYNYTSQNMLRETYVEDAERQVESRTQYKYDEQGRIAQRSYNDQYNNIFKREVYIYGADGNILKTIVYDSKDRKIQEWRYEYDSHRQAVSQTLYDYTEDEPEVFFTLYRYDYDPQGNWIRKVEYSLDGDKMSPEYIIERRLEYF